MLNKKMDQKAAINKIFFEDLYKLAIVCRVDETTNMMNI